jgi:hypothetical protein
MINAVTAGLLAAAAQGSAAEWIGQAEPAGFVVGHSVEGAQGMIVERIPSGESVQRWTRMVTVQRFAGAAGRIRPEGLLENMARGVESGCAGGRSTQVTRLQVSGRPAARFRADCPLNPSTGLPETFFALAIAGESDMHVAQVAFRRVPSAEDAEWAARQIASVVLCTAASREPACNNR